MRRILPLADSPYDSTDTQCAAAAQAARDLGFAPDDIYSISIYPGSFVPEDRGAVRLHVKSEAFDRLEPAFADDPDDTLSGLRLSGRQVYATYTQDGVPVELVAIYDVLPVWLARLLPDDLIPELSASVLADLAQRGPGRVVAVDGGYRWVRS